MGGIMTYSTVPEPGEQFIPRTRREAFGYECKLGEEEEFEDIEKRHAGLIWIVFCIGFVVALWSLTSAKAEAPNISRHAPNISHIHCTHIHRHVCGMDGCRTVDIKRLCWRAV